MPQGKALTGAELVKRTGDMSLTRCSWRSSRRPESRPPAGSHNSAMIRVSEVPSATAVEAEASSSRRAGMGHRSRSRRPSPSPNMPAASSRVVRAVATSSAMSGRGTMLRRVAIAAKPTRNQGIFGPVMVVGWLREAVQVTGASIATRPSLINMVNATALPPMMEAAAAP